MYDVDYDKNTSYNLLTIIARLFITSECENKLKNALIIVKKWEVDLCNQILLVQ